MTTTTMNNTYHHIFETTNGKAYLSALPKIGKITSGQSFLYKKNGTHSMVIDIRLTNNIDQKTLQESLNKTLQRYPYLTSKLVLKNNKYYLAYNKLPMVVTQAEDLRRLGGPETNNHLVDVTFNQHQLFISYHHALTDGRGIMPFVNTLLYNYFSFKNNHFPEIPGINLSDDPLQPDEMNEHFDNLPSLDQTDESIPETNHHGHQLIETSDYLRDRSYRQELVIDRTSFMKFAKAHHATPAIAISIMVSQAIQQVYPNITSPLVTNMASDLRNGVTNQNTFRNCVGSIPLAIATNISTDKEFTVTATQFRDLIKAHKTRQNLRAEVSKMAYLFEKLDALPTFDDKQKMLNFIDNLLLNTFILSYSGQTKLGEYEQYIDEMHTYMSGTKGLSIEMLATNGKIFVDITQSFNSDVYITTLAKILKENNIQHKLSKQIYFKTPMDSLNRPVI
ncbi:hypothetical protein [Lentilactobacillus hilgardii]|uniref:hypothetical protein n=1 Tax=Lentilactobacillus hilgardii TaxID=1588 RepID=UPI003FA5377D